MLGEVAATTLRKHSDIDHAIYALELCSPAGMWRDLHVGRCALVLPQRVARSARRSSRRVFLFPPNDGRFLWEGPLS